MNEERITNIFRFSIFLLLLIIAVLIFIQNNKLDKVIRYIPEVPNIMDVNVTNKSLLIKGVVEIDQPSIFVNGVPRTQPIPVEVIK